MEIGGFGVVSKTFVVKRIFRNEAFRRMKEECAGWVKNKSQVLLKVKSGLFFNNALWKIAE